MALLFAVIRFSMLSRAQRRLTSQNCSFFGLSIYFLYNITMFASKKHNMILQKLFTLMILIFRTYRSGETVQTQIRLLLEEQSDQGLHCLLFHLHLSDEIPLRFCHFILNFRLITAKFSGVRKIRNFMVMGFRRNSHDVMV